MDKDSFEKYLRERYYPQLRWYEQRSGQNKKWYQRLQIALILFSSITPVLIAIDFCARGMFLKWIPIITSVIATLLSGGEQLFKFQEHWINYRTTAESLRKEWYYYWAEIGEYMQTSDKEKTFINRVESLISKENTLWLTTKEEYIAREKTTSQ